jgi:hypothetical protein
MKPGPGRFSIVSKMGWLQLKILINFENSKTRKIERKPLVYHFYSILEF